MQGNRIGLAALVVAIMAMMAAISGVATGLTGSNNVDRNDLKAGAVQFSDLSPDAKKRLRAPAATAVITGPESDLQVTNARGMSAANVKTNNGDWCIDLSFTPRVAQVRTISGSQQLEAVIDSRGIDDENGCYVEEVTVDSPSDNYTEKYQVSIYK